MTQATETALKIERRFDVPVEQLYAAWTDPDQLKQWMGPGDVKCVDAQVNLNVGGTYRIHMVSEDGDHIAVGEYLEIVPGERLRFTWGWESGFVTNTKVTVDFRDEGEGSALTLVHEEFPERDATEKHTEGWTACLDKLSARLNPTA